MKLSVKKLLGAVMMLAAFNAAAAEPQIGNQFDKTAQVIATDNPNKIEVTELFWYGSGVKCLG
jgi:thiol:disulfide interchange protein DsbA